MPKVPVYEQQVQLGGYQPPAMPEAAFGAGVAAANQGVSAEIRQLGQMIANRAIEQQEKRDTQQVLETETQYRVEMDNLLYNADNGMLTTRTLNNANGVTVDFDAEAEKIRQKYATTLKGANQQAQFEQFARNQYAAYRDNVIKHEATQQRAAREEALKASLDVSMAELQKNPSLDNLIRLTADYQAKLEMFLSQEGASDEVKALRKQQVAGQMAGTVIENLLTVSGDHKAAREVMETFKEAIATLPEGAWTRIQDAINDAAFWDESNTLWSTKLSKYKLADGSPDLQKIEAEIGKTYSGRKREEVWDYIKGRANEAETMRQQRIDANNRSFLNELQGMKSKNAALKLVNKYAIDAYDRSLKKKAVEEMFAPVKVESDPGAYIALWEGARTGQVSPRDVDAAFKQGLISLSDWKQLRKDVFNQTSGGGGASPEQKQITSYVNLTAQQEFKDKGERDKFKYFVLPKVSGKSIEEATSIINDYLKTKVGGMKIFGIQLGGEDKWKAESKQEQTQNLAWGKIYTSLGGKDVAMAIGQGILSGSGKKSWGISDIQGFITALGGPGVLKKDSLEMQAIRYLMQNGMMVTVKNVKAVLAKFGR